MKYPKLNEKQIKELKSIISDNSSSNREIKRCQAILMLDKRKRVEDISEITGLKRAQIFHLRQEYFKQGIEAIKDKRKKNPKELLTKSQKQEILKILKTKKPRDYDFENDYWTTAVLGDFIKQRYNVQYKSKTSFYLIFKQAKFSYRKPGRIYHLRDEKEVQGMAENQ
jgi:transposase